MCWYANNVERWGAVSRERGLFSGMSGSKWRMCTVQTSFFTPLQLCYSLSAPTCGRGCDLFISASSGCCSCISIFAALQIVSVRGFNRSQLYSPLLTVNLRLSHHFQLLLCLTYSLSHSVLTQLHCYHVLICNLNPKCCIFSFSNSTVSTQHSAVISPSTKRSSFSGLCRSRPYLCPPLE